MTKKQKKEYKSVEELKKIFNTLKGQKFVLSCGHHVTFGHILGNDITYRQNGDIVCSLCGYEGG